MTPAERIAALEEVLAWMDAGVWDDHTTEPVCPACLRKMDGENSHEPSCHAETLRAIIKDLKGEGV